MNPFQQLKKLGIFFGILLGLLGLTLLIFPTEIIKILATLVGAFVVIAGILQIISLAKRFSQMGKSRIFHLVLPIILLALGAYILFHPDVTITFVSFIIGIFALVSGIDRFSVARQRSKQDLPTLSTWLSGLIHFGFGIAMLLIPIYGSSLIVMIAGIYLLVAGIMVCLSAVYFLDL